LVQLDLHQSDSQVQ